MLGHEIRVFIVVGFLKPVRTEHALVHAGSSNRAHMVKVPRVNGFCKLNGMAGTVHIDGESAFLVSIQVIDCRDVLTMTDLALELLDVFGRNAQLAGRQIATNWNSAGGISAPVSTQRLDFAGAIFSDQEINRAASSLQKLFDQTFAD